MHSTQQHAELLRKLDPRQPITDRRREHVWDGEKIYGVDLRREWDEKSAQAQWQKKHQGEYAHLALPEQNALSTLFTKQIPHVAVYQQAILHTGETDLSKGARSVDVRSRDCGLDLSQWQVLCLSLDKPLLHNPVFFLAVTRAVLNALCKFHEAGFVHCDLKRDNLCIPLKTALLDSPTHTTAVMDLSRLTLIDMQFCLLPDGRTLPQKAQPQGYRGKSIYLAPTKTAAAQNDPDGLYVSQHYMAATQAFKAGDESLLKTIDWRIDFHSLGAWLDRWLKIWPLQKSGVDSHLYQLALTLPSRLQAYDHREAPQKRGLFSRAPTPQAKPKLPHWELMGEIDQYIGRDKNHEWTLKIPKTVIQHQTAPTTVISGDTVLISAVDDAFDDKPDGAASTPPAPPPAPPPPPPSSKSVATRSGFASWKNAAIALALGAALSLTWWKSTTAPPPVLISPLQALQTLAQAKLELSFDKPQWAIGEPLRFTVQSSRDGYLTLFAKGAGNAENELVVVQRNVRVAAGAAGRVTLPNPLEPVLTQGPVGTAQVLAVVTATPMGWKGDDGELLRVQPYRTASEMEALFTCINIAVDAAAGGAACKVQSPVSDFAASGVVSLQIVEASASTKVATDVPTVTKNSTPNAEKKGAVSMLEGYQILDGGTAINPTTGLEWMRCALGQTWNGSTCQGTAKKYAFEAAKQAAETLNSRNGFDGKNDWRVPTVRELSSLVRCSNGFGKTESDLLDGGVKVQDGCLGEGFAKPTLSQTVFPDTPRALFWSSSPHVGDADVAWSVNFNYGLVLSFFSRNSTNYVRLVRAGQ